jgi:hypothetical protein
VIAAVMGAAVVMGAAGLVSLGYGRAGDRGP